MFLIQLLFELGWNVEPAVLVLVRLLGIRLIIWNMFQYRESIENGLMSPAADIRHLVFFCCCSAAASGYTFLQ
jgi:hypothetical protein